MLLPPALGPPPERVSLGLGVRLSVFVTKRSCRSVRRKDFSFKYSSASERIETLESWPLKPKINSPLYLTTSSIRREKKTQKKMNLLFRK